MEAVRELWSWVDAERAATVFLSQGLVAMR
jgi:hypothetical protein